MGRAYGSSARDAVARGSASCNLLLFGLEAADCDLSLRASLHARGKLSKKNYVEKADRRALDRHLRELTQASAPKPCALTTYVFVCLCVAAIDAIGRA